MNRIFLILFFVFPILIFGQNKLDTIELKSSVPKTATQVSINLPDTLLFKNIIPSQSSSSIEMNMPWITALLIGILSVLANLWVANILNTSNEKNLKNQIENAERNLQRQIDANKETTLTEFKITIATKNRQEWVTEARNVLSELLTQAKQLNIEFNEKQINVESKKKLHEKVTYNRIKISLLLKPEKLLHKALLNSLTDFMITLDDHLHASNANSQGNNIAFENMKFFEQLNQVIEDGRKVFYDEWGKIQSII